MFTNKESLDEDVSNIRNQLRLTEISLLSVGEQLSHSGGHDERYDQQTWKHGDGLAGHLSLEDLQRPDVLSHSSDLHLERTSSPTTADTRACSSLHNSRAVSGRSRSVEAVMEPAPLKKKLGFLRQENTCLSMQNQQLISDLKQAQVELATSQSKIRVLGSTVGVKTTNVTVMREQLVALEAEVEDQAKELREAQIRAEKSQQTAALSDGQLIQLRDELYKLQTELDEKTRLIKRAEQQRNLALVNAEKLQEAFKEYKANISIKLKKVMEDESNLKETLIECDREREELESKCVTLERQHADQCEVISHLQEEAVQARTLTAERSDLQTRLAEAGRRVSSLERELDERAAQARETGALHRELEKLRGLVQSQEDRVTQSQREAQQSQAELASLEAVVALLHLREGNDGQLCVKPCALPLVDNAGTTQLLKPKPGEGYQQLLPILQTFEAEQARQSRLTQRLQERLSRAQEEISSLQNSMAQRASHFQDLHADLLEKMSQAGNTEKELKRKSARVSALDKQLREKTSAYTQVGQRNTELEKLLMEKTSSIEHYQSLISRKQKEFQQALDRGDNDHAVECHKMQETLEMLQLSLEQAKERGLELDQEVASAHRDREDAMTLALSLQASLDQLTQEKEVEVQSAQKALMILKEQAAKSESKVHELEECLCQCEKELNCSIVQTEKTKRQYKSQLEALNNQLSSLQENLANATVLQRTATEQNLRLQVTLQQQRAMLQEGERRVAELEENQSTLQTQVSSLEQELERTRTSLQEELVRREKELEEAQCGAVEMNSRTSQLSCSVTRLTSEMSKCRVELCSMEKELQVLRQEASSKSLTISHLEQSLQHAQKLLDTKSDMVLDLEEKLHRSEADRRDLVQQAQLMDGQLQAVRGELSGTLKHLEDLRDMLERTQLTADQRQLSLEKLSEELRQSQRELEDRTHEVLDLDTALKERQGELQQRAQLLSQLDVAIKDHKLEMEKKMASLQDVLGTREKELRDRDGKLTDQDKRVKFLNERLDILKAQLKETTLKEKDMEEQVLQLHVCQEKLRRAAVDLQDTRCHNENLTRELDTLGQKVEKKEMQLCAMEEELTGNEALWTQEKLKLLDTIASLEQEQEQEREQHSMELSSLQQTRGQLLKVSEQISSSMKVSQEHLVSKLEETQSQLDLVRAQYDQSRSQAEQLQLQLEQTQNQAEQFQLQLEQTTTQSGELQFQLEESQNQAEQFQVQLEQMRSRAGQYKQQLEQLRTQAGQLQVQLERTSTHSGQLQAQLDQNRAESGQLQLELEQAQTQASLLRGQLEEVIVRLDKSKNQEALLQAQLLSAGRALQSSNKAIVLKESEVNRLQARISGLETASALHHSTGSASSLPSRTRSPPLSPYTQSHCVLATHDSVHSPQRDPTSSHSPKRAHPADIQLLTPPCRQPVHLPSLPPPAAHTLSLPHLGQSQATMDWQEGSERMRELSVESSLNLSPRLKATLRDALAQPQHLPWDSLSPSLSHYLPLGLQEDASPDHSWQGLSQVRDTFTTDLSFNPLTYMVDKLGEPEEEEEEEKEGGLPQRVFPREEERDVRRESVPSQAGGGGGQDGVSSLSGMLCFVNQTLAMQEDMSLWSSTPLSESGRPDLSPPPIGSQVLHCTGHMRPLSCDGALSPPGGCVMTVVCEPIPHPSSVEFPLDCSTFLTRHSMDLCFTHCEGRVSELVGYQPDDLIGRSAYEFHHALDFDHVNKSLHILMSKGQVCTSPYRFLAKGGGFVWTETQATVLYNSKTSQPEAVVCLNFILSVVEHADMVFSTEQTRCTPELQAQIKSPDPGEEEEEEATANDEPSPPSPTSGGSGAADLYFSLKKKTPEDLLQLAPEAGDTVVSLSDFVELSFSSPPSPVSLPDYPESLCTPELRSLLSPIFGGTLSPSSSSSSSSPSTSPPLSSPSPAVVPSPGEEQGLDTDHMEKLFTLCPEESLQKDIDTKEVDGIDLDMLAPYISMDDDFQLSFQSCLPEDTASPESPRTHTSSSTSSSRKRTHNLDEDTPSRLLIRDKRSRHAPSSVEQEMLFNHSLLRCLEETDPSDLELEPSLWRQSQLLTDKDPILGGSQGLCDAEALMKDIFISRPPDPIGSYALPLSLLT